MTYAMIKKTTKLMPLMRHKRSQNTGVVYALVDEVIALVDALMRISSRTEVNSEARRWRVIIEGDRKTGRDYSRRGMSVSIARRVVHASVGSKSKTSNRLVQSKNDVCAIKHNVAMCCEMGG